MQGELSNQKISRYFSHRKNDTQGTYIACAQAVRKTLFPHWKQNVLYFCKYICGYRYFIVMLPLLHYCLISYWLSHPPSLLSLLYSHIYPALPLVNILFGSKKNKTWKNIFVCSLIMQPTSIGTQSALKRLFYHEQHMHKSKTPEKIIFKSCLPEQCMALNANIRCNQTKY